VGDALGVEPLRAAEDLLATRADAAERRDRLHTELEQRQEGVLVVQRHDALGLDRHLGGAGDVLDRHGAAAAARQRCTFGRAAGNEQGGQQDEHGQGAAVHGSPLKRARR
jgi:hypothetical protein